MDLNQLLIFAKVVEYQSFTKAAQALQIEKSTVSSKVSQLEERLGIRLLNRTTRSVTLTEAGSGYYHHCQQMIESATEAEHYATTLSNEPQGKLRISAPLEFGKILIRSLIKPFLAEYPKIELDLNLSLRLVDLVREQFDVALRIGVNALEDSSLIAKPVLSVDVGFYAAPDYIRTHDEPNTIDEIHQTDFIVFNAAKAALAKIHLDNTIYDFNPKGRLTINDMAACQEAAKASLGIAILPTLITEEDVNADKLVRIMNTCKLPAVTLFAVYPSRQWVPAKLKVFLDALDRWEK